MSKIGPCVIDADPYPLTLVPERCALIVIDMQRDFLEPGGFGAMLGNDVSPTAAGPSSPTGGFSRHGAAPAS